MSKISHPSLICTYCTIIVENFVYIMMPLMSYGDLKSIISFHFSKGIHDEIAIATILKMCLEAIECLNKNNWFHRDVKASNILLGEDGSVCLGDYGVSSVIKKEGNKTYVGSLCWMAPEIANNQEYTYKIDIWSLGITSLEIANGKPPYQGLSPVEFLKEISGNKIPCLVENDNVKFSEEFKKFIADCLIKNPNERPSAKQVLEKNAKFFEKAKDKKYLLQNILKGCPTLKEKFPKLLEGSEQIFGDNDLGNNINENSIPKKDNTQLHSLVSKESMGSLDDLNTDEQLGDEKIMGKKVVNFNALQREVKKNENDLQGMFNDLNEEES